jgi:hypothetical protein
MPRGRRTSTPRSSAWATVIAAEDQARPHARLLHQEGDDDRQPEEQSGAPRAQRQSGVQQGEGGERQHEAGVARRRQGQPGAGDVDDDEIGHEGEEPSGDDLQDPSHLLPRARPSPQTITGCA